MYDMYMYLQMYFSSKLRKTKFHIYERKVKINLQQ